MQRLTWGRSAQQGTAQEDINRAPGHGGATAIPGAIPTAIPKALRDSTATHRPVSRKRKKSLQINDLQGLFEWLAEWTSGPLGRHSVSLRPRFQSGLCGQRKRPLLNVPRKPIKSASHPGVVAGVVDLGGEPCRADHPSVELPTPVMMPHRASRAPRQATLLTAALAILRPHCEAPPALRHP
jgi:hypothetical protein